MRKWRHPTRHAAAICRRYSTPSLSLRRNQRNKKGMKTIFSFFQCIDFSKGKLAHRRCCLMCSRKRMMHFRTFDTISVYRVCSSLYAVTINIVFTFWTSLFFINTRKTFYRTWIKKWPIKINYLVFNIISVQLEKFYLKQNIISS